MDRLRRVVLSAPLRQRAAQRIRQVLAIGVAVEDLVFDRGLQVGAGAFAMREEGLETLRVPLVGKSLVGVPGVRRIASALVEEAREFLSGRSGKVKSEISSAMQEASAALDFERAAMHRDRLAALSHVQGHQGINPRGVEEADVFAIHQDGGQSCIEVFFFRTGQNWGNRAYFPMADPALVELVISADSDDAAAALGACRVPGEEGEAPSGPPGHALRVRRAHRIPDLHVVHLLSRHCAPPPRPR